MLQNAYLLAKVGADTAENEQHFAEILLKTGNYPTGPRGPEVGSWLSTSWEVLSTGQISISVGRALALHLVANFWPILPVFTDPDMTVQCS